MAIARGIHNNPVLNVQLIKAPVAMEKACGASAIELAFHFSSIFSIHIPYKIQFLKLDYGFNFRAQRLVLVLGNPRKKKREIEERNVCESQLGDLKTLRASRATLPRYRDVKLSLITNGQYVFCKRMIPTNCILFGSKMEMFRSDNAIARTINKLLGFNCSSEQF
ncbi:hypothetical protein ACSBR2_015052 [Camellia fascicularis]